MGYDSRKPVAWDRLRPYQQHAAEKIAQGACKGLWASTGVGKTAILLAAWSLIARPSPILIITKALGRHVWPRDAKWVLGSDYMPGILWAGKMRPPGIHASFGRRTYTSLDLALTENIGVVTNYEVLKSRYEELSMVPWRGLVLDEVHEIKGGHKPAKRRDGTYHLLKYHWCMSLATMVRARGGFVWSATATPIIDRRRDLFAQIDVVSPGAVGSAYGFLRRYCGAHTNQWGGLDTSGETNTEELRARMTGIFHIIQRAQVADQMPPISRSVELVPYDGEMFRHMGGSVETALDRTAEMKHRYIIDTCADFASNRLKVLVCTTRRRLAHRLTMSLTTEKFEKKIPRMYRGSVFVKCVTGAVDARERVSTIEEFNNKQAGPAILVATIDSLRDSVDIHQTDEVIVGGLPHSPGALYQLEGRFSRLMGRPVTIRYPIVEGTIDEVYRERIISKMEDVGSLNAETQGENGVAGILSIRAHEEEMLAALREGLADLG